MIGAGRFGRLILIGLPFAWLALFFLLPLAIVFGISLSHEADAIPPFVPPVTIAPGDARQGWLVFHGTLESFVRLFRDECLRAYVDSVVNAALAAALCLAIGYPIAFAIARAGRVWRNLLLLLIMLPFWTSFLIRVYAWMAILQPSGLLNRLLIGIGLIERPLPLLYNAFSLELGLVYAYLPFMILPLYGSLSQLDPSVLEAASDLGARPLRRFVQVILPLSLPGVVAGTLLVFIPAVGEFVIPDLLGGPRTLMIGKVLWTQFFDNRDWPGAAATAMLMVAAMTVPILLAQKMIERGRAA